MHLLQVAIQSAATAATNHAEVAIFSGAGLIMAGWATFVTRALGKLRDGQEAFAQRFERVYIAVCGNPAIDGDHGVAGQVNAHTNDIDHLKTRVRNLEEAAPILYRSPPRSEDR